MWTHSLKTRSWTSSFGGQGLSAEMTDLTVVFKDWICFTNMVMDSTLDEYF